jgi:hypothetical protein
MRFEFFIYFFQLSGFSAHTSRDARPLAEFWFDRWRAVDVESQLFFSPLWKITDDSRKKVAGPIPEGER